MSGAGLDVAILGPLHRHFTYAAPDPLPSLGTRLRVPFGHRERIAIALNPVALTEGMELKAVSAVLDPAPLLPDALIQLLAFGSAYYHHPLGDCWATALPAPLARGQALPEGSDWQYRATIHAPAWQALRGPRQQALLRRLMDDDPLPQTQLDSRERRQIRLWEHQGWVERQPLPSPPWQEPVGPLALREEQMAAVQKIRCAQGFTPFLLDGVTGSGKTEVYLQALEPLFREGKQALLLVPEIGLVPQTLERCQARFGSAAVCAYHSDQSDGERLRSWMRARGGQVRLVVGTRSALFVPLARPGMIIVDEEHDPSYKQHSGWLYSARDLALRRAQLENCPIVLGSATPALESLYQVERGRYTRLVLQERAGHGILPRIEILPLRQRQLQGGLDPGLIRACADTLAHHQQALFFLNRRGYAQALLCHDCGEIVYCPHCSAPLTWHQGPQRLRCHHCGHASPHPRACPACGGSALQQLGAGTEQLESVLQQRFPEVPVLRLDRDTMHGPAQWDAALQIIHSGAPAILVGTQMLSKGHHFPHVTLVGIVHVDQGLYSADFRAGERLAQTVIQVAGRGGRGDHTGRVLLQTHVPQHPLLNVLCQGNYYQASRRLLEERAAAGLPPQGALALLRAEARRWEPVEQFLEDCRKCGPRGVKILGPHPSLLERRAGYHRAQLWIEAPTRVALRHALTVWRPQWEALSSARKIRWSLDVDPQNF